MVQSADPDIDAPGDQGLRIACPLLRDGRLFGAVAIETPLLAEEQQQTVVRLLQWGSAWLDLLLSPKDDQQPARLTVVFDILIAALRHERLEDAATATATELAHRLSCERVSFGFAASDRVRVQALSHSAQFESRSNLVRDIESAMDEALALGGTIRFPSEHSGATLPLQAHAQLAQQETEQAICSVVLTSQDRPVGVMTLERRADQPFDASTEEFCQAVAALLGPILEMKRWQDRPWIVKLKDATVRFSERLFGTGEWRLKLDLALLAGLIGFLTLATGDYRITAPASLEGTVQRAVVAPFEGYIAAAHVRAGETVKAGTVLAELDDKDLRLERRKWKSEREELNKQFRKALAELDHPQARILRTQVAQAEAQLELLDEQLKRTRMTAPYDGVVISGDLSRSLGTPVERGQVLFEVAPLEGYRVVLEVDERDIPDVKVGQEGLLALSAMPGERFPLTVEKVANVSETEQGGTAFRVETRLEAPSSYLRPGMQGIGKVLVGERKLLWIWSRRLIGWFQLWFWSWWP